MSGKNWIKGFQLVVDEIYRIKREGIKEDGRDFFHNIPSPGGMVIIGSRAGQVLAEVCTSYISTQEGYYNKVSIKSFLESVKRNFFESFLDGDASISQKKIDKILSKSLKWSAKYIIDQTHFIPCHLVDHNVPLEFNVGPVRFVPMKILLKEIDDEIKGYVDSIYKNRVRNISVSEDCFSEGYKKKVQNARRFSEKIAHDLIEYYSEFGWAAVVVVSGSDPDMSRWRAHQAVTTAVDAIRLCMKPGRADRMRVAQSGPQLNDTRFFKKGSEVNIIVQHGNRKSEVLSEEWCSNLSSKKSTIGRLETIGEMINLIVSSEKIPPLMQRYLDSLNWFGFGCVDAAPAGKLIKFVSSVERLVLVSGENKEISKKIIQRVASLNFNDGGSLDTIKDRVSKIYNCRSRLVHGDISPYSSHILEIYNDSSFVCQISLIAALDFFRHLNLKAEKFSNDDLKSRFENLCRNIELISIGANVPRIDPLE